jgi:general secretion pathway protein D
VQRDDDSIADDEWVTRVITLTNIESPPTVPLLRPLIPLQGHFAALAPNKLIIVDRYANVRRITEILRSFDQ